MVEVKRCEFNNVFVFGNVLQRFVFRPGVFKIVGENRDKGGSNGSGKTSLLNIICFAFYGKPFEDDIEDIQNYTNSSKKTPATVSIEFSSNFVDYKVVRTKAGSTNGVTLFKMENDEWVDITLGKGIQATNAEIISIIGFDFDVFCLTYIFSGNVTPFLKRSATEQRKIIECLFDASDLTTYADQAKVKKTTIETELKVEEARYESVMSMAARTTEKLNRAKESFDEWEESRVAKIAKLDATGKIHIDEEGELEKFTSIDELNSIIRDEIQQPLSSLTEKIRNVQRESQRISSQLSHLKEGNCPFCNQAYSSPETINQLQEQLVSTTQELESLVASKTEFVSMERELQDQVAAIKQSLQFRSISDLRSKISEQSSIDATRENLLTAVNPHAATIESLMGMQSENVNFDTSKIDALRSDLEHIKLLIQLLTNRDSIVRTSIISAQTSLLNSRIQQYSKLLDLPQVLHFDANMKCSVMEFGRSTSYGNLSAGEKRRANLSLSYAFRDLVMLKHGGINLLMMDEIDGGSLDQQACLSIVKSLYEVCSDSMILVISHNDLVSSKIGNEIRVVKECGFSTIA